MSLKNCSAGVAGKTKGVFFNRLKLFNLYKHSILIANTDFIIG